MAVYYNVLEQIYFRATVIRSNLFYIKYVLDNKSFGSNVFRSIVF